MNRSKTSEPSLPNLDLTGVATDNYVLRTVFEFALGQVQVTVLYCIVLHSKPWSIHSAVVCKFIHLWLGDSMASARFVFCPGAPHLKY
jgi:hypothetical protein